MSKPIADRAGSKPPWSGARANGIGRLARWLRSAAGIAWAGLIAFRSAPAACDSDVRGAADARAPAPVRAAPDTATPTRAAPLDFDSEIVRLRVGRDSLEVEGFYRFLCRRTNSGRASLIYPYPSDSLMGGARTVSLEARSPSTAWRPLAFTEQPAYPGAAWRLPTDWGDTLEVRTVYRQRLVRNHARYIVTTTSRWPHALKTARFEIRLPPGARPVRFSFPFRPQGDGYVYEAAEFMPDRDVVVEWER
jgi:hypothetical protein